MNHESVPTLGGGHLVSARDIFLRVPLGSMPIHWYINPMICLVCLPEDRFEPLIERTVNDFAQDISDAKGILYDEARVIASQQVYEILPNGYSTPNQFFFLVHDREQEVGHLWFGIKERKNRKIAFIYDFNIEADFRGFGFGKETLRVLEVHARKAGAEAMGLHVFKANSRAVSLYEGLGYIRITDGPIGFEMEKAL